MRSAKLVRRLVSVSSIVCGLGTSLLAAAGEFSTAMLVCVTLGAGYLIAAAMVLLPSIAPVWLRLLRGGSGA
jgi:hypothetical protein